MLQISTQDMIQKGIKKNQSKQNANARVAGAKQLPEN